MSRFFNVAGPNSPRKHYTLPVLARLPGVRRLIDREFYFVVHAPRQVGKTTAFMTLAQELTAQGQYVSALVSMETGAGYPEDIGAAELAILDAWRDAAEISFPREYWPPPWPEVSPGARIRGSLRAWSEALPKPLVVFLDEIDALEGDLLISVLRQIRDGYRMRPKGFPHSLALIGMRNVRDYKIASGRVDRTHSASPFNIASDSMTLGNFSREDVGALYAQHTEETEQVFLPEAVDRAYELTRGQPWLVNALARQVTEVLVPDQSVPITPDHIERAKEILVRRRDTHLDSLAERLREPRVRAIIEPMLIGDYRGDIPDDDIRFITDLGLMRMDENKRLEIANPIYREIIARQLSSGVETGLPAITPNWLKPDGKLDKEALLHSFVAFWRQHGEPLMRSAPYHEAAPHLVMMAFLHRVVNGGSIDREYAIGTGRLDLCVHYGGEVLAIELKVWRDDCADPLDEGLGQLDGYLDGIGQESGWLVIFDRRKGAKKVAERVGVSEGVTPSGRRVKVVRG